MKNYVQSGGTLTLTAPTGGVVGGQGYLIGAVFVVAVASAAEGKPFAGKTIGVFEMAKTAAQAVTEGALIYWDNTNRLVTTTSSGNTKIGAASQAALAADAAALVRLNGSF
jgi:predicted RecA/RadA family phage recombinase